MVRLTDSLDMTIVVDWDVKQHSNKHILMQYENCSFLQQLSLQEDQLALE